MLAFAVALGVALAGCDSNSGGDHGNGSGGTGGGSSPADGVGPRVTQFTDSGPIMAVSGATYSGLHITSADGPCIQINGATNVTIVDSEIGPCGADDTGIGVQLYQSSHVTIHHNSMHDVASGVYATQNGDGNVVIEHNYFRNVRGPMPRGQYVQFGGMSGPGSRIRCNVGEQGPLDFPNKEDSISIFNSSGSNDSPIEIAYNKIRGGSSASGCGIMAGDFGGAYIAIHRNNVVQTGGCGVAIAGGHDISVTHNKVFSPKTPISGVGGYVWAQGNQDASTCYGNTYAENVIRWTNDAGVANHFWDGGNCAWTGASSNLLGASIGPEIFDEVFDACR